MADIRGIPLLSGPPPQMESSQACRKCNREFNMFLTRSRKCNHCGYLYCHNCTDYQALMPRSGQETGYSSMNVCAFCIEYLGITASGKGQLRTIPLSKLRKYVDAYNIQTHRAVEKDDLVEEILAARTSSGCLAPENENYYRKYSVPNRAAGTQHRSFFSRNSQTPPAPPPPPRPAAHPQPHSFPRPDLAPDHPPHQYQPYYDHQRSPPRSQTYTPYTPPPPVPPRVPQPYTFQPPRPHQFPQAHPPPPPPPHHARPHPPPPHHTRPHSPPPRPATSQAFRPPPPQPRPRTVSTTPPPSLDQLLEMPDSALASLSISALKAILFTNHVNAGLILEKSDLVNKVRALVEDERHERERQRMAEEAEEAERIERQRVLLEEHNRQMAERQERAVALRAEESSQANHERVMEEDDEEAPRRSSQAMDGIEGSRSTPTSSPPRAPPVRGTATTLERTGLCVICQDDEANIAIVDCGHLAMCRDCSELVMKSSRECPLCRTRIVTEARLLRIFKT